MVVRASKPVRPRSPGRARSRSHPGGRGRIGRAVPPRWRCAGRLGVGAFGRDRTLGDDHDRRELAAAVAALQSLAHVVDVEGDLGHEDLGRTAGDAGVGGDPPHVPTHDLAHDDAVMGLRGGAQAIDGVGGDLHGGVEAEGDLGSRQVVVDGLRDTDGMHTWAPRRCATPRVSSPPTATSASTARAARLARTRSGPSSIVNGLVRDVPRMVPPSARMSRHRGTSRGTYSSSRTPFHPSRYPMTSSPWRSAAVSTTARITALSPGQSPPPVRIPMRMPATRAQFVLCPA